ncbi:phosphonate metabolism protein/1,5-bisphosphokinase (PRPP-forming) PhnN [Paraburkholderia guartelaensis]|uniref:Ribose 1,5-bisphosphate phosphokinase PhnN n=1 Tax=Paraburkholderia guartelaensis TaxID=2546446 RepID=A0A4R5L492_9BURK|nr:phosphonate metabolism protein/1,5-bisphosphokinase (PRPP-forming) PhnN [Paraburkholderia guartelaensis]TDG02374.1 phosphonate metabolism protein/1,5-bisphosphokinase (PRPP-forming) PhnN [Paraburkholderia guartelaensis]
MSGMLIYVSGPSGSGKDSLLRYAREQLSGHARICFAHRYITRAADAGGENHVALSAEEFAARSNSNLFALDWASNGLQYGIGSEVDHWLDKGLTVVMNGSREYLSQARARYPYLVPVEIAVPEAVLRERLLARGRETPEQVAQRLQRNRLLERSSGQVEIIRNDGDLEQAGQALISLILRCAEPS